MSKIPSIDHYEEFSKFIRYVIKYELPQIPAILHEDIVQDVYVYFLTEKGKAHLDKAETIKYLRTQVKFRAIDYFRIHRKPLKTSTLESEMIQGATERDHSRTPYTNAVDEAVNIEEDFAEADERRQMSIALFNGISRLTITPRCAYVIRHWSTLYILADEVSYDRSALLSYLRTSLNRRDLMTALTLTDHRDRATQILMSEESSGAVISRKLAAYQKAVNRAERTLQSIVSLDNVSTLSERS